MNSKIIVEKKAVVTSTAAKPVNYRASIIILLLMLAAFIIASVKAQHGGWLAGEADMFLVDHLNPHRPFLSKILAPHVHDAHQYQARELSHFFEHFDVRFINWCVKQGIPHFLSITSFAFLAALSVVHWRQSTKYLKMDPIIVLMLIAMFWTAPSTFFSGPYIRVAKQGASFFLLLLCWRIITCIGARPDNAPGRAAAVLVWLQSFLLTLAMCWMDRQGYFLAGVLMLTLLAFWVGPPIPYRWVLISAMVAGLAAHTIYSRYIGPDLILKHTGFTVSFEYQKLPWKTFFDQFFKFVWDGIVLMGNTFRWYFGNLTGGLTLFVWAAMAWLFSRVQTATNPRPGSLQFKTFFGILFVGWLLMLIFMNSAMVLRHEPLIWPDVRTHYYWIPTTTLVLIGCTLAVYVLQRNLAVPVWVLRVALAACVISNISALPEHNRVARTGHLQGYIAAAPHLLNAIRELSNTPEVDQPKLEFDAARLSRIEGDFNAILKNPLAQPNMTVQDFVFSSHFYNYLRSRRNLEFRQPP